MIKIHYEGILLTSHNKGTTLRVLNTAHVFVSLWLYKKLQLQDMLNITRVH